MPPTENYIVECKQTPKESFIDPSPQLFQQMKHANNPNQQLVYTLFSDIQGTETRLDLIESYLDQYPLSPYVMMDAVTQCTLDSSHQLCTPTLIEKAIEADSDNGAMWLNVASFYATNNQREKALQAMNELMKTSIYNGYDFKAAELFLDVLAQNNDSTFEIQANLAIGLVAAKSIALSPIFKFCTTDIINDKEKTQACIQLGNQLETHAKSTMTAMFGNNIKGKIYDAEKNKQAYEQTMSQRKHLFPTVDALNTQAFMLSLFDETLFRRWLYNVNNVGEIKASGLLVKEAIESSRNPHYNPCPKPPVKAQ